MKASVLLVVVSRNYCYINWRGCFKNSTFVFRSNLKLATVCNYAHKSLQIRRLLKEGPICSSFPHSFSSSFVFLLFLPSLYEERSVCSDLAYPLYPVGWFLPLKFHLSPQLLFFFFFFFFCISSIPPSCKTINRKSFPLHLLPDTHAHTYPSHVPKIWMGKFVGLHW